jgi:hypothetical protein
MNGIKQKSKLETKLDHKTLHYLPFLPTRARKSNFKLEKAWGEQKCRIEAPESINAYDLVTLMFIARAYLSKNWYAGYIGEGVEKREIAGLEIDLEATCKARGIYNKKVNRKTIFNSIRRLSHIDILFQTKTNKGIMTKYLYEVRYDLDYKKVKVYANKNFIEFITKNGISLDLDNFVKLEQIKAKSKDYAILLYAFMSGTKTKREFKGKTIFQWREKYNEELLFDRLGFNETKLPTKRKREELKKAFELLHINLNLPVYSFDKIENMWIRTDLIEKRLKTIK